MARLFVAIWPTEEVIDHVRSLPRDTWRDVRWIPESNWHITLRFIGEVPPEAALGALTDLALPAATAEVSAGIVRLGTRSLIVPVEGVDALARAVRQATQGLGTDALDTRFRGHLTVGRSNGQRPIKGEPRAAESIAPVRMEVQEVAVITSTLTNHGALYDSIGHFPTGAEDSRG